MILTDVKLVTYPAIEPGTLKDGLPLPPQPEITNFVCKVEGADSDATVVIPTDPANSHYWLVKEWYEAQDPKPFDFDFGASRGNA